MKKIYAPNIIAETTGKKRKFVSFSFKILMMVVLCLGAGKGWGQSYLGLDGGFEGTATIDNTGSSSGPTSGKWTRQGTISAIANETTTKRSGNNSLKISSTSTTLARIYSPSFTITSSSTAWTVQYYRRSASTTNTQTQQASVYRAGSAFEQSSGYTTVSTINTWEKYTYANSNTTVTTSAAMGILNKALGSGGDMFIDDVVLYTGGVDNTAPLSPGTVTVVQNGPNPSTKLDVSWGTASGGIDNGGYIVVRYATIPVAADDPNVNGIYAIGNSITVTNTGTVAYVGTATSFTDDNNGSSLSPGTTYYYKVYTYDKAYNYSVEFANTGTSGTTASGSSATQLVISAINGGSSVMNGIAFTATIQSRDGSNTLANVTATTGFTLSLASGTGALSGTLTGSITAGANSATVSGILYNTAETGVSITATRTSGDVLTPGTSSTFTVFSVEPTAQPTGFTRSVVSTSGMTISWTAATGSPDGYIVLRTTVSGTTYPNTAPVDGTTYAAAGTLGNATVEYVGNSLSAVISGLSSLSQYSYSIYSYNGSGSTINYYTTSPLLGQPFTLATEPTQQSTSVTATAVTATTLTLNWSGQDGTSSFIVAKAGSAVDFVPTDGVNYSSSINPAFGNGPAVGAGSDNYILGSTASSTLNITNLSPSTTYYFAVYTYNGFNSSQSDNFFATPGTVSQLTLIAPPTAQPTGLTFGSVTATGFTVSFTAAIDNPTGYIVLRNTSSPPTGTPVSGTSYSVGNTNIGGGTNTVAYVGPTPTPNFVESGLAEGTTYYYNVYSYNGSGSNISYYTTSPLSGNQATTAVGTPTANPGNSITHSSFGASWNAIVGAVNYKLDVLTSFSTNLDDFTDGDFTSSPVWSGNTSSYSILTSSTLPSGIAATDGSYLGSNSSVGNSALYTASSEVSEWRFSLGSPTFNPSSGNFIGVVLISNSTFSGDILTSSFNGYYLRVGVDGSTDYIELWKSTGTTKTKVGDFSSAPNLGTGALQDGLNLRITRNGSGVFTLYYSTGFIYGSLPASSGGTLTDNTYTSSSYFGVYTNISSAAAIRRVYIDNIVLGSDNYVSGYQDLTVSGTSQSVSGLSANTTYYYRVRTVGASSTSPNSNIVTVLTYKDPATTDYRTKTTGNLSSVGTWEYNYTGSLYQDATQIPTATNNVTVQNGHTLTMDQDFTVGSGKTFTVQATSDLIVASGATLTTGGNLILKSDINGTAMIGNSAGAISGDVTVERFIGAATPKSAWRLMTAPLRSTGSDVSVFSTWQDNGGSTPGIGTQVTGPGGASATTGLDDYTIRPSMQYFDFTVDQNLHGVTNTKTTNLFVAGASAANKSYFIFTRGDRSVAPGGTANNTTFAPKGALQMGDQTFTTASTAANDNTLVGNPYASPVDLNAFRLGNTGSNIKTTYYYWDPYMTGTYGVGGYVTVSYDAGGAETITPSGATHTRFLQSGQAMFLERTISGGGTASVTFKEDQKATTNVNIFGPTSVPESMGVNLNAVVVGTPVLVDGVIATYDNSYAAGVDDYDATKFNNVGEGIALVRSSSELSIERRPTIVNHDTLFLKMRNLVAGNSYRFDFVPTFNNPLLTAFLQDSYVPGSNIPVSTTSNSSFSFTVTTDPATAAANRFRIVFGSTAAPLAIGFSSVKAYEQNHNIAVEWSVENEMDMKQYEVEKSVNGSSFTKVNTTAALNRTTSAYSWLDVNAVQGYNYYRIRSVSLGGEIKYSSIVKVYIGKGQAEIVVYPNPISAGTINLQMNNMAKGTYSYKLINYMGQVIQTGQLQHNTGNSTETITLKANIGKGVYSLEIIQPDNSRISNKIFY